MNLILCRKRGVVSNIPECSTCGKPSPLPNWCWGRDPLTGAPGDSGYYEMGLVYVVRGMDLFAEGGLGGEFMRMLCSEWSRQ